MVPLLAIHNFNVAAIEHELYHPFHKDKNCSACSTKNPEGSIFKCIECINYILCSSCWVIPLSVYELIQQKNVQNVHGFKHAFLKLDSNVLDIPVRKRVEPLAEAKIAEKTPRAGMKNMVLTLQIPIRIFLCQTFLEIVFHFSLLLTLFFRTLCCTR